MCNGKAGRSVYLEWQRKINAGYLPVLEEYGNRLEEIEDTIIIRGWIGGDRKSIKK